MKDLKSKAPKKSIKIKTYKIPCIILSVTILVLLLTLGHFIAHAKTVEEQKYLDSFGSFVNNTIQRTYNSNNQTCKMDNYFISKDGDVAAKFTCIIYDKETLQPINEEHHTAYFEYSPDLTYFSQALGD